MPETLLDKLIEGADPEQMFCDVEDAEAVGVGLTVIEKLALLPAMHPERVGITDIVEITGEEPEFNAVKDAMFPEPLAAKPIAVLEFVQL